MFVVCRACVAIQARRVVFRYLRGAAVALPPFAAVMALRTLPRPAPKLANGHTQRSLGIARSTRIRAPEVVPEFTAKAFADHHRRIRLASRCEPKTMDTLGCSGGKPWQTPHFVGNGKAAVRAGPVPLGTSPTRPQPSFRRCDRALNGRLQTACIAKVEGTASCSTYPMEHNLSGNSGAPVAAVFYPERWARVASDPQ